MEGNSCKSDGKEGGIEFSKISLRPFNPSDVDDIMEWATDEKLARFSSWGHHTSKEEVLNFMMNVIIPHPWFKAICLDDKPIGEISVTGKSGNDKCRAEIGYILASKYWGKGIATYAVKLVANDIFWEWPHLERLEALADVENLASQRVLEKAGFQREGILRKYYKMKGKTSDMVMFSLLFDDLSQSS
ncbi:uncharacterized protein LOC107410179 [Ziziphus jujuba]|uniref:Uncharacterized protein LOC107410179 n=2 Tax=Ziziphus jujuba TaxID=326968 RepID=A0A6P3Z5Y2_ZIZJJ|nr:uncharacterized protein LOC107410179 [Ziziphus jujuba]KAH7522295.1 hypothetical protein FEM48_Zijuj07G0123200 [Ziziphus jujuba var. spinosa]